MNKNYFFLLLIFSVFILSAKQSPLDGSLSRDIYWWHVKFNTYFCFYFSIRKFYGITPPINTNYPTDLDLELSKSITDELEEMGYSESIEESKKRYFY